MQLAHIRQAPGFRLSIRLATGLLGLCTLCVCVGGGQSGVAAWPAVGAEEGCGGPWAVVGRCAPTLLCDAVHRRACAEGQDV